MHLAIAILSASACGTCPEKCPQAHCLDPNVLSSETYATALVSSDFSSAPISELSCGGLERFGIGKKKKNAFDGSDVVSRQAKVIA